jgi:hypothetical protein
VLTISEAGGRAHARWEEREEQQQKEFLALLDITVTVTGPVPSHNGRKCPVLGWFVARKVTVPVLTDELGERVKSTVKFAGGHAGPRQKGGPAPRTVREALLGKARTGITWVERDARYGCTGL